MAYFPESYAGDIWNKALGNIAGQIGQSIDFYRKRHDELSAMDSELSALSGMTGVDGKPIIDPKAYERITAHTDKERFGLEKGYLQAVDIGQGLQKANADIQKTQAEAAYYRKRGDVSPLAGQTIYDDSGRSIGQYDEKGLPHYHTRATEKIGGEEEQPAGTSPAGVPPGGITQKASPWWQSATNEIFQAIAPKGMTGPFKLQPEVKRGIPIGPTQQGQVRVGQPQSGTVGVPPISSNPDANRIKAMFRSGQITREEAIRRIRALGYTDIPM